MWTGKLHRSVKDAQVLLRQVRRQFSAAEDGLLALSPPELIAMDYIAQGDLQLRTDDLQWLLNPESSLLRLIKGCQRG